MAGAEHLHLLLRPQQGPDLLNRSGVAQAVRTVGEVAGPVGQLLLHRPGRDGRDGAGEGGREEFEERSFVHGCLDRDGIKSARVMARSLLGGPCLAAREWETAASPFLRANEIF